MKFDGIAGKICMVTGGGGSIGSELVRQLTLAGARGVVIVDIYENGAYNVWREVGDCVSVEIASVCDCEKLDFIMEQYKPDIIFHAAAHKHVPFMEQNPEEAVKNNIRGTQIAAELAQKHGAQTFVLISTDKAVEPISVMGASKRICEMLVYEKSLTSPRTKFTAVRFGNVINSEGSVIPLFRRQIKTGRVTVTDKDATRYFMSLPQAAELAAYAASMAEGGEVFVFEMGKSKKILDIAEELIRAEGKEPYKDIAIEFTGLRKGDKLHEKLFFDWERQEDTPVNNITRVRGSAAEGLSDILNRLYRLAAENKREEIRSLLLEAANVKLNSGEIDG